MVQVSIIIPVYKVAEHYLRQCLSSVVNQTLQNIEIILIDDGSPDNCGAICDEYAANDGRIRVIHQESQGVSVARNNGIAAATGKWLAFVDADDWIELNMCEEIVHAAETLGTEILHFAGYHDAVNKTSEFHYPLPHNRMIRDEERINMLTNIYWRDGGQIIGSICCSLYSAQMIKSNDMILPVGITFGEDQIFQLLVSMKTDKIAYYDKCYYHYRKRRSSTCHKFSFEMVAQKETYLNVLYHIITTAKDLDDPQALAIFYLAAYNIFKSMLYAYIYNPENKMKLSGKAELADELLSKKIFKDAFQKNRYTFVFV